ncbi:MAG: V-type ATP synthase subunit I [Promethearchaeota archaeon]
MKKYNDMTLFKVNINRNYKDQFLTHLSLLKNVHIKQKSGTELKKKIEEKGPLVEKIKELRQNFNVLCKTLKISEFELQELKVDKENRIKFVAKDLKELMNKTSEEINYYTHRINEIERYIAIAQLELEVKETIKKCYEFLEKFDLNRFSLTYFDQLNFKVFTTFSKNLENLKAIFEFSEFPNFYQTTQLSEGRIIFFIIYPREKENDFIERKSLIHAEEVHLLKKYLTYDKINFSRINKEIANIEKTLLKYKKEFKQIRDNNLDKFAAINEIVYNIEEYNWAERQFEEISLSQLVIKFFVPLGKSQETNQKLCEIFKENVKIQVKNISKKYLINKVNESQIQHEEKTLNANSYNNEEISEELEYETPTMMKNYPIIRSFETLTKMYGVPAYNEIDPTPFIAITFPLLFGLMFGDIGHGICLMIAGLIGALIFVKRENNLHDFSVIIFFCGLGAVFAGFLYGDFFGGHEILGWHLEPIFQNPMDDVLSIFMFVVLIGIIHINFGWFIQFLNYWKQDTKYLSFSDSFLKILLLTGGSILLFTWHFDIKAWLVYPYPILLPLVPGLLLMISKPFGRLIGISYLKEESYGALMGEGSFETFETFLSILSNVSSYIRILALALTHIALMLAIQVIIGLLQGGGIFIEILRVIGLIFGNIVVILLEGVLVFINAIRLHFYEFFFKFYQGTGSEFFPFLLNDDYSIIIFNIENETDIISEEIEKEINLKNAKENIERAIGYITSKYL